MLLFESNKIEKLYPYWRGKRGKERESNIFDSLNKKREEKE